MKLSIISKKASSPFRGIRVSLRLALFAAAISIGVFSAPRDARALDPVPGITSLQMLLGCLRNTSTPVWVCRYLSKIYDPVTESVTGLSLNVKYDSAVYRFDPSQSGPLGIFSVGGDAPPLDPGIGTEPLQELPSSGYTPGSPLPGSTLTLTDSGDTVAVDYQLAIPVTLNEGVNFFRLTFEFLEPVTINLLESTATYLTEGEGADFSVVSFACTTLSTTGGCGSDNPSSGVTLNLAFVHEPSTVVLLGSCIALLVGLRCHRRRFQLMPRCQTERCA